MRKVFMFAALVAASTAFVGCSSDEDLTQAPVEPTATGVPFSVSAFGTDDTRAVRYGTGGVEVDGGNGNGYVQEFLLYGVQDTDPKNIWINNLVYRRTGKNSDDWAPNRSYGTGTAHNGILTWPATNTGVGTQFYAVTDGNIPTGDGTISGFTNKLSMGKFDYAYDGENILKTISAKGADGYKVGTNDSYGGWVKPDSWYESRADFEVIDNAKIYDLMVAEAEGTAPASGRIPLAFHHALAGLSLTATFQSEAAWAGTQLEIYGIIVHGLSTKGTYTYGSETPWGGLSGANLYYYGFGGTPKVLTATTEAQTPTELVPAGTWLLIPQSVTGWDESWKGLAGLPASGAYLELLVRQVNTGDGEGDYGIALYPFTIDFKASKNYTLDIKIANIRTAQSQGTGSAVDPADKNAYWFTPSEGGGL